MPKRVLVCVYVHDMTPVDIVNKTFFLSASMALSLPAQWAAYFLARRYYCCCYMLAVFCFSWCYRCWRCQCCPSSAAPILYNLGNRMSVGKCKHVCVCMYYYDHVSHLFLSLRWLISELHSLFSSLLSTCWLYGKCLSCSDRCLKLILLFLYL